MTRKRPPIRIRFKYNMDTGEIEEFIIDDNAPNAKEAYHEKVAHTIAGWLARHPEIEDAGPIRLPQIEPRPISVPPEEEKKKEKPIEEQKD